MKKIRCIAVDDEPLALAVIKRLVEKTPGLTLLAAFDNPLHAQEYVMEHEVDLIFLDVDMPDLTGIAFVKTLSEHPQIIFTTAHAKYALEGFEYDAVDFLLKPILWDRFLKAVNKSKHLLTLQQEQASIPSESSPRQFMFVKSDNRLLKVKFDDILFIEGMRDYVGIHTSQQRILTLMSMRHILEKLPPTEFIRVHRSYIVGIHHIYQVHHNKVKVAEHDIPISETYKGAFTNFIDRMNA